MDRMVGIDDLNVYAGSLAVAYADVARARDADDATLPNIGFVRRSVLPPYEDPVTLAVNAAMPVVAGSGSDAFGLLIVATETGLDFGKPLSSYVHQALGLPANCRNFELKHACYAGTAALQMAMHWVRGQGDVRRKALVVMTDVARRRLPPAVELTAGAGAVALSIDCEPRVVQIEPGGGCAAHEVYDVTRPTATTEWDDSLRSVYSYLDLLELAWEDFTRLRGAGPVDTRFDHMLYHTPLVALVRRAHQTLLEMDRPAVTSAEVEASFDRMVCPSLTFNRELGNIYSGSLYASLAGLVETQPALAAGSRIGLFSYGSGACAEVFEGRLVDGARAVVSRHEMAARLGGRREVGFAEYEAAGRAVETGMTAAEYVPDPSLVPGLFEEAYAGKHLLVLERVEHHHRRYGWS